MFFDVKNWAKNTRLACKVRKKLNYSWKESPLDQIQWCTKKINVPESCDLENLLRRMVFLAYHRMRFKLGLRRPMLPFPMLQTLRDSQHVSNSDFRGFWFCVLRPIVRGAFVFAPNATLRLRLRSIFSNAIWIKAGAIVNQRSNTIENANASCACNCVRFKRKPGYEVRQYLLKETINLSKPSGFGALNHI